MTWKERQQMKSVPNRIEEEKEGEEEIKLGSSNLKHQPITRADFRPDHWVEGQSEFHFCGLTTETLWDIFYL